MDNEDNEAILTLEVDFSNPGTIVIAVLIICSALLSIIGSTTILVKILRDRAQNGSTTHYDRFMVGLSSGDIWFSIDQATQLITLAIASPASCRAFGVSAMLSTWSTWYNGLLSCYFLITILSQVRGRKNSLKRCEPWMHLSVMYFPIAAILSYSLGWSRPNDLGTTCENDPIGALVPSIPVVLAFLFMIVNYSVIYAVVRKTLKSSNESSENVGGSTPVREQLFRESTNIMTLYVGSFLVTYLPYFFWLFNGIFGDFDSIFGIVLHILMAILFPLQGVFNAIIYLKPFYTRFRAAYPNKSKWFVLRQAVLNSKAPRLNHRRIANHHTYHSDVLITDITLTEEDSAVNPNEVLFNSDRLWLGSNDNAEQEENGAIPDNVEESDFGNKK